MRDRLIKLLGGITRQEYENFAQTMREQIKASENLLNVAEMEAQERDNEPRFCHLTEGCAMQDGHFGGCRDISGLCFSTLHQKELARKRQERAGQSGTSNLSSEPQTDAVGHPETQETVPETVSQ